MDLYETTPECPHMVCQAAVGSFVAGCVSSPGFCGGWFIWCRWLPVVIVPGGGGRVPRRVRARRGFACRWRSVAGWCPYQWPHSAVATSTASMSCQGPWPKDELGLVQRVERLGQSIVVGIPLRAYRGDCLAVGQGLPIANGPVLHPTVASGAPGPSGQHRLVSAARRPSEGRPGPGRCTGRWRSASPRFAARRHR